MSPWTTGRPVVEEFVAQGLVTRLVGADAGREDLMATATNLVDSAAQILERGVLTTF